MLYKICENLMLINMKLIVLYMFRNTSPSMSSVRSSNPVLYTNITCNGWESHLLQCSTGNTAVQCSEKAAVDCFSKYMYMSVYMLFRLNYMY